MISGSATAAGAESKNAVASGAVFDDAGSACAGDETNRADAVGSVSLSLGDVDCRISGSTTAAGAESKNAVASGAVFDVVGSACAGDEPNRADAVGSVVSPTTRDRILSNIGFYDSCSAESKNA